MKKQQQQQQQQLRQCPTCNSLRARAADFFMMDVPQATRKVPSLDRNPLRRSLKPLRGMDVWETNENMCTALWELMARG